MALFAEISEALQGWWKRGLPVLCVAVRPLFLARTPCAVLQIQGLCR